MICQIVWENSVRWVIHWHIIIEESSTRMSGLQSRAMSGLILMQWPVHDQAPHHKFRLLMHRKVRACKMWNKISAQDQDILGSWAPVIRLRTRSADIGWCQLGDGWWQGDNALSRYIAASAARPHIITRSGHTTIARRGKQKFSLILKFLFWEFKNLYSNG